MENFASKFPAPETDASKLIRRFRTLVTGAQTAYKQRAPVERVKDLIRKSERIADKLTQIQQTSGISEIDAEHSRNLRTSLDEVKRDLEVDLFSEGL